MLSSKIKQSVLWAFLAASAISCSDDEKYLGRENNDNFSKNSIEVPFSEFLQKADSSIFDRILLNQLNASGVSVDSVEKEFTVHSTSFPINTDFTELLADADKSTVLESVKDSSISPALMSSVMSLSFIIVLFYVVKRQLSGGNIKHVDQQRKSKVRLDDVAGIDEAKEEAIEVIEFLKNPKKSKRLGAKSIRGLLLAGAPGVGKTLLAKAIAGEASVPFYSASATEFETKWFGDSAKQVRELFKKARANAPCIIFIDEIDAIGMKRSGNPDRVTGNIVQEILAQMDGFNELDEVVVVAATNRPESLDPALLRPGRFDRQLILNPPDMNGREQILKIHTKNRVLDKRVNLNKIASITPGMTGADLENLVNIATTIATKESQEAVTEENFDKALDRITMGRERSIILSDKQKWTTAVHEAGHAILSLVKEKEGADPLHKVSIIPRGKAMGVTLMKPTEDRYGYTVQELEAMLCVLYAGRIAEEITLGGKQFTGTGASNDIERATDIAFRMVKHYGFSDLGAVLFGSADQGYLGQAVSNNDVDEYTSNKIYEKAVEITNKAQDETRKILSNNKKELYDLAKALMKKESLLEKEVREITGMQKAVAETFKIPDFKELNL